MASINNWVARWQDVAVPLWWIGALVLWLGVMIATPIAGWIAGDTTFPTMATLGVLTQSSAVLAAMIATLPRQTFINISLVVFIGTWAVEALGVATGFPFGHYEYTSALQPQLAEVPLLIPLAWLMMLGPAWAITDAIYDGCAVQGSPYYRAVWAATAALAFTAWDLYLDPQMVARELWVWDMEGAYFGIPLINFVGWFMVSFGLSLLLKPTNLPRRFLLLIYSITWVFQAIGLGVFWGQPGPALVGFGAMGIFATLAIYREVNHA